MFAGFATLLPPDSLDSLDWLWRLLLAGFGISCGFFAWNFFRAAERSANARDNHEPQLTLDEVGIIIRDGSSWRASRIPWSRIATITAVLTKKGISIVIFGDLTSFDKIIEVLVDDDASTEAINARLARFGSHRRAEATQLLGAERSIT